MLGVALGAVGVMTVLVATVMPARTMDGARLYAWLSAYRRTLQKTLAAAQSMNDVVASRAVPWLETPDQAMVWGVAFGLHEEVEAVLVRSASAEQAGQAMRRLGPLDARLVWRRQRRVRRGRAGRRPLLGLGGAFVRGHVRRPGLGRHGRRRELERRLRWLRGWRRLQWWRAAGGTF